MAGRLLCTVLAAAALAMANGLSPPSMSVGSSSARAASAASSATPTSSPAALPFRSTSLNASAAGSSKNDTQTAAAIAASERLSQNTAAASKWPAVTPLPAGRRKVLIYDFDDTLKNGAMSRCGARGERCIASRAPTWENRKLSP
jgi:hypothetical protein